MSPLVEVEREPSPAPPPAGTAHLRILTGRGGIGFWTPLSAASSLADVLAVATQTYNDFANDIWVLASDNAVLEEVTCRLYVGGGGSIEASYLLNTVGGVVSDPMPANCAALLSWAHVGGWRGGQPRSYIPGIPKNAQADPVHWSGAFTGALQTGADNFLTHFNAHVHSGANLALSSMRFFSGFAALTPPTLITYVGVRAQARICTQRRRLGPENF